MDGWEAYLHWSFRGEQVLISSIRLDSLSSFLVASMMATSVCVLERCITHILDRHWEPSFIQRSYWRGVTWRSSLYWLVTFLRLSYMLIAMSFHLGLLLVMVTALTVAQTLIDIYNSPLQTNLHRYDVTDVEEPLLDERHAMMPIPTRSRSKSKADIVHIRPDNSSIARAGALDYELDNGGRVYRNDNE